MSFDDRDLDLLMGNVWDRAIPPVCPRCGYNLIGTGGNRCPECGVTYMRRTIVDNARNMEFKLRELGLMNDLVMAGVTCAAVSGVVLCVGMFASATVPELDAISRVVGRLGGAASVPLGLNVLRVKRLPRWALAHLPDKPRFALGAIAAAAGVLLIAFSLRP